MSTWEQAEPETQDEVLRWSSSWTPRMAPWMKDASSGEIDCPDWGCPATWEVEATAGKGGDGGRGEGDLVDEGSDRGPKRDSWISP